VSKDDWQHLPGIVARIMEKVETPRIAAIPTIYAGVNFRSRLEARWAAFFDLRGLKWDYEPVDFDGWIPDFLLRPEVDGETASVWAEIKPTFEPEPDVADYAKAVKHGRRMWVLLLGAAPLDFQLGHLVDREPEEMNRWQPLNGALSGYDASTWELSDQQALWREAGNRVQWKAGRQ
jgi:hypothetical protein